MQDKKFITFYGEYSLQHWIELILSNEITLPNFQRYFVWDPKRTIQLMDSFDKGLFVPPILIANFSGDTNETSANYVLDGQQRLSAILLTFLGVFPERFKQEKIYGDEANSSRKIIDWDFKSIQKTFKDCCHNDIKNLAPELKNNNLYCPIDINLKRTYNDTNQEDIDLYLKLNINEEFLKTRYLGYSFIKAIRPNPKDERGLFGAIFKNINTSSIKLRPNESRSALYWISGEKQEFFKPKFLENIKIKTDSIDFVRYMALLSNAHNLANEFNCKILEINENAIAIGYARPRKFEEYITKYVEIVTNDEAHSIFGKFSHIFPEFKKDLNNLKEYFNNPVYSNTNYTNFMTADFYLFGLFYWVLFKKKKLVLDESIKTKILEAENHQKEEYNNKNLNRLGAIRKRLITSISIYSEYLEEKDGN